MPVKDWGPKGYGKCNRKHIRVRKNDRLKMIVLRAVPLLAIRERCKPHLKQEAVGSHVLRKVAKQQKRLRSVAIHSLDE